MLNSHKLYAAAKFFVVLSGCTLGLFLAIGLGSIVQSHISTSPVSSMKGMTASVSSDVFKSMLASEMPFVEEQDVSSSFTANMFSYLFQIVTGVHPDDPRTILSMEVPGLANERAVLFRGGQAGGRAYPMDMTPPQDMLRPHTSQPDEKADAHGDETKPEPGKNGDGGEQGPSSEQKPQSDGQEPTQEEKPDVSNKVVFIYHSHNRESWLPELEGKTAFSEAFDPEINVTLLGKRLAKRLEEHGIGAISSDVDYPTAIPGYNWNYSYKYSLDTVREAMAVHSDLNYFFDIHRDAQARDLTTVTIDGVDYAQLYFIIGHRNPEWEKNEAFASEIHARLEERYPGISRGVWGKSANTGHAEYNQTISPNSILIEVGGPENTLEESYRTIDLLAEIFAEYYWEKRGAEPR